MTVMLYVHMHMLSVSLLLASSLLAMFYELKSFIYGFRCFKLLKYFARIRVLKKKEKRKNKKQKIKIKFTIYKTFTKTAYYLTRK